MRPRDADISKGLQGGLTILVADAGGCRIHVRHRVEDAGDNDHQLQMLPILLRIQGISEGAADTISATLDELPDDAPLLSRREICRRSLPPPV